MLGTPVSLGSVGAASGNLVLTTGVDVPFDSTIFLASDTNTGSGASPTTVTSATDNKGNTYAVVIERSVTGSAALMKLYVPGGLPSGTQITVVHSSSVGVRSLAACYVAGEATVDRTSSGGTNNVTAWNSGTTANTSAANELAIGVGASQSTAGNSNTNSSSPAMTEIVDNTSQRGLVMTYANAIGSGVAVTAAGTFAGSGNVVALVATFTGSPRTGLGVPVNIGATGSTANVSSKTVTTTKPIPAGATGVIGCSIEAGATIASVTDSNGNTWTVDVSKTDPTNPNVDIHLASFYFPAGLALGATITVTFSGTANGNHYIIASYITGRAVIDVSAVGANSNLVTAWTTAATSGATANGCVAIGLAFASQNTLNSNQSGSSPAMTELGDATRMVMTYANDVSSGTAVTAAGTWASASRYASLVGVYKEQISTRFMATA